MILIHLPPLAIISQEKIRDHSLMCVTRHLSLFRISPPPFFPTPLDFWKCRKGPEGEGLIALNSSPVLRSIFFPPLQHNPGRQKPFFLPASKSLISTWRKPASYASPSPPRSCLDLQPPALPHRGMRLLHFLPILLHLVLLVLVFLRVVLP